jgi:antitoxin VapB
MGMDITNDTDPDEGRLAAKIDRVHSIVRAYGDTPPGRDRVVTDGDDLYDEQTGLPR